MIADLKGKAVLVTGASSGIGAAAARAFGANGCRVALHCHTGRDRAQALADELRTLGSEAVVVSGDVTQPGVPARIVFETVAALGRIDVLINNAGGLVDRRPVAEYDEAFIDSILALNVKQVVFFVSAVAQVMRSQGGGGSIINLGSSAARHGGGVGAALYAGTKGFIASATHGWAKELARDGIRVNAVSPGVITTPFHARFTSAEALGKSRSSILLDRLGTPEECTGMMLYLASDVMSSFVTGQVMEVNGGQVMP